jgi:hypothetical protein
MTMSAVPPNQRIIPLLVATLNDAQRKVIQDFVEAKSIRKDRREFATWFAIASGHALAEASLDDVVFEAHGRLRVKENKITPAPKQAAIERNKVLVAFLRRYFRRYGSPRNVGQFIRTLKSKAYFKSLVLTDRAVRYIIQNLAPKRGRRKKPIGLNRTVPSHQASRRQTAQKPSNPSIRWLSRG